MGISPSFQSDLWFQGLCWYSFDDTHDGSIHGAARKMVYIMDPINKNPSHVSIYSSTMDPSWDMGWYGIIWDDQFSVRWGKRLQFLVPNRCWNQRASHRCIAVMVLEVAKVFYSMCSQSWRQKLQETLRLFGKSMFPCCFLLPSVYLT